MNIRAFPAVPVLTVEPATEAMRLDRPAARFALVERYLGEVRVVTTDDQCPNGIGAAAAAYAAACETAYDGRVAS